ncbi:triose-phosphate isomerase [Lyticum sinuosum]|nr:triose-phosphate isomerase family protein [Lyticum sinuosum]
MIDKKITANKKYVICNWKMNGSVLLCEEYCRMIENLVSCNDKNRIMPLEIIVLPPNPYINIFSRLLDNLGDINMQNDIISVRVGAQSISSVDFDFGSYTGEVSSKMLHDIGCSYILINHYESKKINPTCNSIKNIQIKLKNSWKNCLIPIVCIGHTIEEHDSINSVQEKVFNEINEIFSNFDFLINESRKNDHINDKTFSKIEFLLAYEPSFTIGSDKLQEIDKVDVICSIIKDIVSNNIESNIQKYKFNINMLGLIYGGSIDQFNIKYICNSSKIDGFLIGRKSLDIESLTNICYNVLNRLS